MISEDFAFFGFDETSWDRLASLFLGDEDATDRGVLVLVVDADGAPSACFHTGRGSLDLSKLPPLADLEALCDATDASVSIVMRERAMANIEEYLAEPLDPDQDFVTRVMRFIHVLRELGDGNWLRVHPNPLPDALLAAVPVARPLIDFLLPPGHCVVLGVFERGELWTGAALRREQTSFDVFAGPGAISEWAGPLGGDWRRDHRVLTESTERELGPVHVGLFMERTTAQRLLSARNAGDWALAFATRELIVSPFPRFAAAGLGVDVLGGAAQIAMQVLQQIEPEEMATIVQGFWSGLTDGEGLQGLKSIATTWKKRLEIEPLDDSEGSGSDPLT